MEINIDILKAEYKTLAQNTLKVVSASSLKLFALEIENATKSVVSKAIEEQYNTTSSKLDGEELSRFLDLTTGYMVIMKTLVSKTSFEFPQIPVMEEPDEINATPNTLRDFAKRKEVQTFGLGTALSVILFFSGIKLIALVTEAIATTASVYIYTRGVTNQEIVNEQAKQQFEKSVNDYMESVENNALTWIEKAKQKSSQLIESYT